MLSLIILFVGLIALLAILMPQFDSNFIPGQIDENTRLEVSTTKTATYAGTTFDQGVGYAAGGPGRPASAVVKTSAFDFTTTDETYKATLQESADNATWNDCGPPVSITAVGAVAAHGFVSKRYARVGMALGGTTPSITYEAWLVNHQ